MKNKYSLISIIAGVVCMAGLVAVNQMLAAEYRSANGKTQALFGMTELVRIERKLYFAPFAVIALVCCILALSKNERTGFIIAGVTCTTAAIVLFFVRFWQYMV